MNTSAQRVSTIAIFEGIMPLHENIKAIRLARGLRQIDVAERAGLTKSAYSKVERGTRNLTIDELRAMAELFGMTMNEVVDFNPSSPEGLPAEPNLANADDAERLRLISQLPDEDRLTVFRIVDQFIANHRFREFFAQNAA